MQTRMCAGCICVYFSFSQCGTFLWLEGELVPYHVDGDQGQQHRGEGDEKPQVLTHGLLYVGDGQKHNGGIQVDQPVEPKKRMYKWGLLGITLIVNSSLIQLNHYINLFRID